MTTISSISEFLTLSNCQFRIYDLGRKTEKLSKELFNKVEENQLPYPTPSQGHAHLAIAFWQRQSEQPYLWFIKLPLDERGLLNQGARNHFIAIITEALGSDLSVDPTEKQEELLKSNPYLFTPSQYKLAMLNSLLSVELKVEPSRYYASFIHYLNKKVWSNWQNVGVQGITDYVARIDKNNVEQLSCAFIHLPFEVLSPLCGALENIKLPLPLINAILEFLATNKPESSSLTTETFQMLLRSLASSVKHSFVDKYFEELLGSNELTDETLIVISGRCWQTINTECRAMKFLELLAQKNNPQLFAAIFKDLVAIPAVRPLIFKCMRDSTRSEKLSIAIGQLFNS